jgi:soluble lytic murein transglycosylase
MADETVDVEVGAHTLGPAAPEALRRRNLEGRRALGYPAPVRIVAVILALAVSGVFHATPAVALPHPEMRDDEIAAAPLNESMIEVGEPVFPQEQAAAREAIAALQAGRAGQAADILGALKVDAKTQPYVDYLLARCDAVRGRLDAADAGFQRAEAALPSLADHIRGLRARVLLRANREAEADALIQKLPVTERQFAELNFGLVRRWMNAGRAADVLPVLDRMEPGLAYSWDQARLARLRADAHLAVDKDRRAWLGRLATLWRTWPRTAAAREAEEPLLARFSNPKEDPPLTVEELIDAAADRARSGGAEALTQAIGHRLGGEARGLEVLIATERAFPKRLDRLLVDVDKALAAMPLPAIEERLIDLKARILRKLDRGDEALALYRKLGDGARVQAHRGEALLEGGGLARRMNDLSSARWFFEQFLAQHAAVYEGGAHRPDALWNLGWIAWREGNLDEADRFFDQLVNEHPMAEDDSGRTYYERALYWRARGQQKRNHITAARAGWRFLVERFPLSYYSSLAAGWLWRTGGEHAKLPEPHGAADQDDRAPLLVENEALPAATLYRLGLDEEARQQLRHLFDLHRLGPHGSELLSALYHDSGDDFRAHFIAWTAAVLDSAPDGARRDGWMAAFPRPFDDDVRYEAKEHGVSASLIWSVMRQESGFQSNARSFANAHGLMQILLPTARLVAKRMLGERPPSLRDVYSIRGNVHYGTAYLKWLLDHFDGHLALAIASYNAGPGAVDRWLRKNAGLEADEFVEEIPYDETRGYTRRVLRNLAAYRHLYEDTEAPDPRRMPMSLPGSDKNPPVSMLSD